MLAPPSRAQDLVPTDVPWTDGDTSSRDRREYAGRGVLVAGASGFLGRACLSALGDAGARVSAVLRRRDGLGGADAIRVHTGRTEDPAFWREALVGVSFVFDFMGTVPAVESNRSPSTSARDDYCPHVALFEACAALPAPPLVVFPSSRLVYGAPLRLPVDEDHPLQPQSVYAVHKIALENCLRVLASTRGVPHVILRISNPFGPGGEHNRRSHGILNHFLRNAAQGDAIRLYGDGAQRRDFIYLPDLVAAVLRAAASPACRDGTFNVGGRVPVSLAEAASLIGGMAKVPVEQVPWPKDARDIETGDYIGDTRKLDSCIGPVPGTPFADALRATLAFYASHASTARSA
jgi:UDP-glucose 4-epimerase